MLRGDGGQYFAKRLGEGVRALVAILALAGQSPIQHLEERGRKIASPLVDRANLGLARALEHGERIVALAVDRAPGEHLVEADAHREEVGAMIEGLVPGLLGA